MAKFVLREGERRLSWHSVALVDGRTTLPAYLTLTTERLVVTAGKKTSKGWLFFLGLPIFMALRESSGDRGARIYYQMRRERFAAVELGEDSMLVFHDTGEGYDHVSFAITHDLTTSQESLHTWQDRMRAWAAL